MRKVDCGNVPNIPTPYTVLWNTLS
jgi:hypothetical protein